MSDLFEEGFESGQRTERRRIAPLLEAVADAIYMLEHIKEARQLPPFAEVQNQYIAMGTQLKRIVQSLELGEGK